jgi:hypothetical protein
MKVQSKLHFQKTRCNDAKRSITCRLYEACLRGTESAVIIYINVDNQVYRNTIPTFMVG